MSHQLRICCGVHTRLTSLKLARCFVTTSTSTDNRQFLYHKRQFSFVLQTGICPAPQIIHLQPKRHISSQTVQYFYSPDFPPVGFAQKLLETVYEVSGLPWWATILLTTITLRTVVTLPIAVYAQWNVLKIQQLRPILKEKGERLKLEVAAAKKRYNWSNNKALFMFRKNMNRIIKEHYEKENCHPMKTTLVFWIQLPIWFGMSLALRNMSGRTVFGSSIFLDTLHPEMSTEGVLWFTNLMLPDPYGLLPLLCALGNLANCEVMTLGREDKTKFQKIITNVYRGLSIIVLPIGLILPSSVVYYWTCSSMFGLAQNLAMRSPTVKRILKLPELGKESKTPYKDLLQAAKYRYLKLFRWKKTKD